MLQYVGEHVNMTYEINLTHGMRGSYQLPHAPCDMAFINGVKEFSRRKNMYPPN